MRRDEQSQQPQSPLLMGHGPQHARALPRKATQTAAVLTEKTEVPGENFCLQTTTSPQSHEPIPLKNLSLPAPPLLPPSTQNLTGSVSLQNLIQTYLVLSPYICIVLYSFKECFKKQCHLAQLSKLFKLKYKRNTLNNYKALYRYR